MQAQQAQQLFDALWRRYTEVAPQTLRIERLLTERGERVVNDHVAFRTFNDCAFDLSAFSSTLGTIGYSAFDEYRFPEKRLDALAFRHSDERLPKIFVSELRRAELSPWAQALLNRIIGEVQFESLRLEDLWAGRLWSPLSLREYERLADESEYAAWLSVMGLTANHFTVSVNHLTQLSTLEAMNSLLLDQGFELNRVGGLIKGGEAVYLAQSSTLADRREETFSCGSVTSVPTCFYEFALRYPLPSGERFEGFVTSNATRIFDSTHRDSDES